MGTRSAGLLLLLAVAAVSNRQELLDSVRNALQRPPAANATHWGYAPDARYYSVMPEELQQFRSTDPSRIAAAVCDHMGGRAIPPRRAIGREASRWPFSCFFHERDLTITADFGDLRRMPAHAD